MAMLNFQHFDPRAGSAGIPELAKGRGTAIGMRMSKSLAWTVWAVTALLLGCFFVWPIVTTVQRAFFDPSGNFTLLAVREVFRNRIYLEGLRNAFLLAVASTAAHAGHRAAARVPRDRFDFPGRSCSPRCSSCR